MISVTYLTAVKHLTLRMADRRRSGQDSFNLLASSVRADEAFFEAIFSSEDFRRRKGPFEPKPAPWGHPDLIAAISASYGAPAEQVIVTSGASLAMFLVCHALLKPGDCAVVEHPSYEPFLAAPLAARASTVDWPRKGPEELTSILRANPGTKAVILSNPHNPTGAYLETADLLDIAEAAARFGVPVIVDEIFRDLVVPPGPPAAGLHPNLISINGLSKVYGLSRLRCAWIVASPPWHAQIRESQIAVENAGSELTQAIAAVVVSRLEQARAYACTHVDANREVVRAFLRRTGGGDAGRACICFPKLIAAEKAEHLLARLEARGVFVASGDFFRAPGHIRIGYGFENLAALTRGLRILEEELG